MAKNKVNSKGFTLVETAVVLVIGSLILMMLFNSLNIYLKNTKLSTTRERIAAIDDQIQIYLTNQGHLPCPAPLAGIDVDADDYGLETDCSSPPADGSTFAATDANVRIGMAPTRTLNLPDEFGFDAWGNRIVYAVTTPLAISPATYSPTAGVISVVDSNNISVTGNADSTHYVVFSPGINQNGAYNVNGNLVIACGDDAATLDEENCDNNRRFRNTVLTADSGGTGDFDDILISRSMTDFGRTIPPQAVMLFRLSACPNSWTNTNVPAPPSTDYIYCRKN